MAITWVTVGWEGWFTVSVLAVMIFVLAKNWMRTEMAMGLSLSIITTAGIITVKDSTSGFSNAGVLTVAILYLVAAGLNGTGALDYLVGKILGTPKNVPDAQARILVPLGVLSAFLNNTPVVAMMIPVAIKWATKNNLPVSQLMIPISYAAIFGGTCTLIGTSTNLVVAGKYEEDFPANKPLGLFSISLPGVPSMFIGFAAVLLFGQYLLPGHKELEKRRNKALGIKISKDGKTEAVEAGKFLVATKVVDGSRVIGKTVEEAKLRGNGFYLSTVERNGTTFPAVTKDFVIEVDDVLFFVGSPTLDFDNFASQHGLVLIADADEETGVANSAARYGEGQIANRIVRALIREGSSLVGKTAKEVGFRAKYDASIVSISRPHEGKVHANIGRIELAVGDELLLLKGDSFSWDAPDTRDDLKELPLTTDVVDENPVQNINTGISHEFLLSMKIAEKSTLFGVRSFVGKTVHEAGLRGLPGIFLIAIQRVGGDIEYAVGPTAILNAGDVVWFAGSREGINAVRRVPGLVPVDDQLNKIPISKVFRGLVEAVISPRGDLVGKTVREARFRTRYDAVIVAVQRSGTRVLANIGDVEIHAGDVLMIEAGPGFIERVKHDLNFAVLTSIEDSVPPRFNKFWIALLATVLMIVLPLFWEDQFHLLHMAVFASAIMIATGCINAADAFNSVGWDVIVTVACAFGLSVALEDTNAAALFGQALAYLAEITNSGFWGVLLATYLATAIITLIVANNASALLMFPVAIEATNNSCPANYDFQDCLQKQLFVLMLGASACFTIPYGYQTNMMVFGPGQYVFSDFVKFGGVIQLWQVASDVSFVYFVEYWYINWAISITFFGLVYAFTVYRLFPWQLVIKLWRLVYKKKSVEASEDKVVPIVEAKVDTKVDEK